MNTLRGTIRLPAVAVLMASLLLAACGPGTAPAEEANAAVTLRSGSTAPAVRVASAIPGRDAPVPTRIARASDVAPGGVCPSRTDEPAPLDGGREVTQVPESDVPVQDAAPMQPEAGRP